MKKTCLILAVLLLLAGCATTHNMVQIKGQSVYLGMTPVQVQAAIGTPDKVDSIVYYSSTDYRGIRNILWYYGNISIEFDKAGMVCQIFETK